MAERRPAGLDELCAFVATTRRAIRHREGGDVGVWVYLPATTWLDVSARVAMSLSEDLADDAEESWREPSLTPADREHLGAVLTLFREVLRQSDFPLAEWDALRRETDEILASLAGRLGTRPDSTAVVKRLIMQPQVVDVLTDVVRRIVGRP